jgi:hypothetical protein
MPHPPQATTATPPADPTADPPPAKKPRGNPNLHLAPRCGARTRSGCPCRSPAIHGKLRCRMHGGRSTGPRTPKGFDDLRAAHTTHGNTGAEARAKKRFRLTMLRRNRVKVAAVRYKHHLPPAFIARLYAYPPELTPPPKPTGGITAAADRMRRHAVAAALAPWKQAIAAARAAERAARAAGLRAPAIRPSQGAPTPGAAAPFKPFRTDPLNREPAAKPGPTAPFKPSRIDPLNREPAAIPSAPVGPRPPRDAGVSTPHAPIRRPADPAAATHAPRPPQAPAIAAPPHATPGRRPTPPRPASATPPVTALSTPHAPDRAPAPNDAGASTPHAPIPGRVAPAIPPDLPNRHARRRWERLQRRKHPAPVARSHP